MKQEQILPILLSIVGVVPALFLGGMVSNLISGALSVGFWGARAIASTPAMLLAAVIAYRWPNKFWLIAPAMTLTVFALFMAFMVAFSAGQQKGLWGLGLLFVFLPLVPCFVASTIGYWLRMRANSRPET